MPEVTKVWIAEGCIVCDACQTTCPQVFHVLESGCTVRPEAREPGLMLPLSQAILDAAEECPVGVIKVEQGAG